MDVRFYGITRKKIRRLAFDFASQNNIVNDFNKESQMAGDDWTKSFFFSTQIFFQTPKKTSVGRIIGFNKVQIERFYDNLTNSHVREGENEIVCPGC